MKPVVVLCPTRGRPGKAAEMVASFRQTAEFLSTELILVVDDDDPSLDDYLPIPGRFSLVSSGPLWPPDPVRIMVLQPHETGCLTAATNTAAARVWNEDCIIGHVGDDHRFRTSGWDRLVGEALLEPGVAAPDDGAHHGQIPTACFISSSIVRSLGWMALPTCRHLYIDNAWREIGMRLGAYHYLPGVLVEHLHPSWGKAEWDDGYQVNNSAEMYAHDSAAFAVWRASHAASDIARIR